MHVCDKKDESVARVKFLRYTTRPKLIRNVQGARMEGIKKIGGSTKARGNFERIFGLVRRMIEFVTELRNVEP